MSHITETILDAARAQPEGGVLSPRAFLHLGSRAAVDQALSRLAKAGQLLRVGRGAYALPVQGKFGPRAPSTEATVQGLAALFGETIVPSGAAEANALGLSTQVPVREVFVTTGRNRALKLGARSLELRHAPAWQLRLGQTLAGRAVRALAWLGPNEALTALHKLHKQLPSTEWQALQQVSASLPSWLAKAVNQVGAQHG
jgi:hypothetical protein